MCGRNSLFVARPKLEETFDATVVADGGYVPRYNVAPGDGIEVIPHEAPDEIDRYHWGLRPDWAEGESGALFNARSETVAEKRAFRDAWASRPCLVLSSGFYEWRDDGSGGRRPYRIYSEERPAFAMAGLWESPPGEDGPARTATVLTTEPNDVLAPIHDRMPVVLPPGREGEWLSAGPERRADLCRPYPDDDLVADEVSTRVNDPSNDDPSVIEPLDHEQSGLGDFGGG